MRLNPHRVVIIMCCLLWGITVVPGTLMSGYASPSPLLIDVELTRALSGKTSAILQDKDGFLWIATEHGVLRYNGTSLSSAENLDGSASWLAGVPVQQLLQDARGNVWIVSKEGIAVWEKRNRRIQRINELDSLDVSSIIEHEGTLFWIGTKKGVYLFDAVRKILNPVAPTLDKAIGPVTSMYKDDDERLWIGTSSGLFFINPDTNSLSAVSSLEQKGNVSPVSFITQDFNGTIWAGTLGDGLLQVIAPSNTTDSNVYSVESVHGVPAERLTSMIKDKNGRFLIGTAQKGLFLWDPLRQSALTFQGTMYLGGQIAAHNSQTITALFQDRTGVLWAGTTNGLLKGIVNPGLVMDSQLEELLGDSEIKHVKTFSRGADGRLWAGTFGQGLLSVNSQTGELSQYRHDSENTNSIVNDRIIAIEMDKLQHLWIATHAGLSRYDTKNDQFKTYLEGPGNDHLLFQDVFVSRDNEILVTTSNAGVFKYNPLNDQFEPWPLRVGQEDAKKFYDIRHVYEDRNGVLWFAAGLEGLIRFDRDESAIRTIGNKPSVYQVIRGHEVISVTQSEHGDIWAGTKGAGIFRLSSESDQISHFSQDEGLSGNEVFCVIEDSGGYIWAALRNGLVRIDTDSDEVVRFDKHDGLAYGQVHFNACFNHGDLLYLGNDKGITAIRTNKVEIDKQGTLAELTGVSVWDQPFPYSGESQTISLSRDQNYIQLQFMIPDYLSPDENKLMYRLDGFEDTWNVSGEDYVVSYTDLDPGKYHLLVKASNHRGVWSSPRAYEIKVSAFPAIGLGLSEGITLGFVLLICLVFTLHFTYKRRIDNLEKKYAALKSERNHSAENIRSQIARDLHDDLGADLSRLVLSLENRLQREDLSDFSLAWTRECWDYAQRVTKEVRHLSWTVDPERNWLPDLVDRIYREAHDTFETDQVDFRTSRIPKVFLPPLARKDIFLIFREAVTNISNHASTENISIFVNYKAELLELIIEDYGVGFDPDEVKEGNGLKNMRRRAQNLNARLAWERIPQGGTRVMLQVPLE